eukprot:scaffold94267_cov32-Tisochrysis_lutea.AAC.2
MHGPTLSGRQRETWVAVEAWRATAECREARAHEMRRLRIAGTDRDRGVLLVVPDEEVTREEAPHADIDLRPARHRGDGIKRVQGRIGHGTLELQLPAARQSRNRTDVPLLLRRVLTFKQGKQTVPLTFAGAAVRGCHLRQDRTIVCNLHLGAQLDTVRRLGIDDCTSDVFLGGGEDHVVQVASRTRHLAPIPKWRWLNHELEKYRWHGALGPQCRFRDALVHLGEFAACAARDAGNAATARGAPALLLGALLEVDEFAKAGAGIDGQSVINLLVHVADAWRAIAQRTDLEPKLRLPADGEPTALEQLADGHLREGGMGSAQDLCAPMLPPPAVRKREREEMVNAPRSCRRGWPERCGAAQQGSQCPAPGGPVQSVPSADATIDCNCAGRSICRALSQRCRRASQSLDTSQGFVPSSKSRPDAPGCE